MLLSIGRTSGTLCRSRGVPLRLRGEQGSRLCATDRAWESNHVQPLRYDGALVTSSGITLSTPKFRVDARRLFNLAEPHFTRPFRVVAWEPFDPGSIPSFPIMRRERASKSRARAHAVKRQFLPRSNSVSLRPGRWRCRVTFAHGIFFRSFYFISQ